MTTRGQKELEFLGYAAQSGYSDSNGSILRSESCKCVNRRMKVIDASCETETKNTGPSVTLDIS